MKTIFFSAATKGFYPEELRDSYEAGAGWPVDAIEVTAEQWREFTGIQPAGMRLGADENGYPVWVPLPLPTHDELVAMAEVEKQQLIDLANSYMNSKQWPGKAAIGRLKGDDLASYNLWVDYLDALWAVDVSNPVEIEWPPQPAM